MDRDEERRLVEEWMRGGPWPGPLSPAGQSAAGELWREVERQLRPGFKRRFPALNKGDTDDAFQQAFVECDGAIRRSRYDSNGIARFPGWASKIIYRTIIDRFRGGARHRRALSNLPHRRTATQPPDPSDVLVQQDDLDRLERAIIDWLVANEK